VLDKFILGHFDLLCWGLFGGGAIIFFAGLGFADLFGTETLHHTSNAVAVGLFILGALFLVFFEDKSENYDYFHEYGQLIASSLPLVSFDTQRAALRNYHASGKILLCKEDGTKYHYDTAYRYQFDQKRLDLPSELQSNHAADVKDIVFVRKQETVIGHYGDGRAAVSIMGSAQESDRPRVFLGFH